MCSINDSCDGLYLYNTTLGAKLSVAFSCIVKINPKWFESYYIKDKNEIVFVTKKQDYTKGNTLKKVWESRVCVMMRRELNVYICGNNALRQYYQQCRKYTFQKQKMDVLNLMNKNDLIYTIAKAQIL